MSLCMHVVHIKFTFTILLFASANNSACILLPCNSAACSLGVFSIWLSHNILATQIIDAGIVMAFVMWHTNISGVCICCWKFSHKSDMRVCCPKKIFSVCVSNANQSPPQNPQTLRSTTHLGGSGLYQRNNKACSNTRLWIDANAYICTPCSMKTINSGTHHKAWVGAKRKLLVVVLMGSLCLVGFMLECWATMFDNVASCDWLGEVCFLALFGERWTNWCQYAE